jgi:ribonucleotide reductase beta subunit family protein with ferritin-like domain
MISHQATQNRAFDVPDSESDSVTITVTVAGTKDDYEIEPLLSGSPRLTVFPIEHPDIWAAYKRQLACFWTAEEIDFSRDREHWENNINEKERHFLKHVLTFFAGSDSIVSINLMDNFCREVSCLEAKHVYTFQAQMENVHAETYSLMIETFIKDPAEKQAIYQDLGRMPSVIRKVEWARKWASSGADEPFHRRLVAFAIVEGLFFSGAFCAIYWIKHYRGALLPGLTKSNEFIARDEGQHTDFACLLYRKLRRRMPEAEVIEMFSEAISIEKEFICEAIPCRLIGMNADLMCQYIEYVADNLLRALEYAPIFGSENPYGFMEMIGMGARSNFFEERPSLYQRHDVLNIDKQKAAGGAAASGGAEDIFTEDF